jgi:hypothetical protein
MLIGRGIGLLVGLPMLTVETSAHDSDRMRGEEGLVVCVDVQLLSASKTVA